MTSRAFIGLGSNLESTYGNPTETVLAAAEQIGLLEGVCCKRLSSLYTSVPAYIPLQPWFINAVLEVTTTLTARELLEALFRIEQKFSRERSMKHGPRTLDCDLLDYEGVVSTLPEMVLPHPGILERDFVVTPLLEIAPKLILADGTAVTRKKVSRGSVKGVAVQRNQTLDDYMDEEKENEEAVHTPKTLSICATPIGNLGDVTLRVLSTLSAVDIVYAEDTRITRKLLTRYDIHTPIERCDTHSITHKLPQLLARLESGEHIAYVTDAGMPGISDPGLVLVNAVRKAGFNVEVLPGASAVTTAVVACGFNARHFQFHGFLPRALTARRTCFERMAALTSSTLVNSSVTGLNLDNPILSHTSFVFYESPYRIITTLKALAQVVPQREVCIARELTKYHEETLFGTPKELVAILEKRVGERGTVKGEIVLVVAPEPTPVAVSLPYPPGSLDERINNSLAAQRVRINHSQGSRNEETDNGHNAQDEFVDPEQAFCEEHTLSDAVEVLNSPELRARVAELVAQHTLKRSDVAKILCKEFGLSRSQAYEVATAHE